MSIQTILDSILTKLDHIGKHQRTFLSELFSLLLGRQGRATFENMARFSRFTELTFRRNFASYFDWLGFNSACVDFTKDVYIGLMDCTFVPKNGHKTFGLDQFWSSCAGRAQRGLEVSTLACVNLLTRQCFALEATQTPPNLSQTPIPGQLAKTYNRVSFYLEQLTDCLPRLPKISYWIGDGFYAKTEFFDLLQRFNRHLITRLRTDADLYFLWDKPREPGQRGAPRKYDGKVTFQDLSRWHESGSHPQHGHITLYAQRLYAKGFGRCLQVVLLLDTRTKKYVLLASTDLEQEPAQIALFYHLRFQIELLFRDAKQFTGLTECQSCNEVKLDYHFNASLSAINLGRLLLARDPSLHGSLNALVRRQVGERIWRVIYGQLSPQSRNELNHIDPSQWQFWQRKAA